jgi:methyl-accepting chemotaxis protein
MTQQNAALVEESAAASASLREQSQLLTGAVSQFHLDANA